jgi:GNAT-family acetyltransferase (TIGR03103 family)
MVEDDRAPHGARPARYDELNRYTQVIVDEAVLRGIEVTILDPSIGELELHDGTRRVRTKESLSELTSADAVRRCDDKLLTRQLLADAGLAVPDGRLATSDDDDVAFLEAHGEIVVKPRRGEGGAGVSVGVTDPAGLEFAVAAARAVSSEVLLERCAPGDDVRIVVIGGAVVAASVRKPPVVTGDGTRTITELITALSEARAAATAGASRIPLDDITARCVAAAGFALDNVLPEGESLAARRTANVHTGGSIEDVTAELHPDLAAVAVAAAAVIDIPVAGIDLMVPSLRGSDHVIIEVNEQPGLANHEPQPTVERFIDLLFPPGGTAVGS